MNRTILFFLLNVVFSWANAQSADGNISKGNEMYRASQFDLAEKAYRKALEASPKNTTAQYNLAAALYKQKKYNEATNFFKTLSSKEQDKNIRASAFYNNGVILSKQNDLEESIQAYKNALRLKPDDVETRENLQKALLELKKQQKNNQQNKNQQSRLNQKEAEQKLKELEEKEKEIQQRIQKDGLKTGTSMPKDW